MNPCHLCSSSTDLFDYVHLYPLCYQCTTSSDHSTCYIRTYLDYNEDVDIEWPCICVLCNKPVMNEAVRKPCCLDIIHKSCNEGYEAYTQDQIILCPICKSPNPKESPRESPIKDKEKVDTTFMPSTATKSSYLSFISPEKILSYFDYPNTSGNEFPIDNKPLSIEDLIDSVNHAVRTEIDDHTEDTQYKKIQNDWDIDGDSILPDNDEDEKLIKNDEILADETLNNETLENDPLQTSTMSGITDLNNVIPPEIPVELRPEPEYNINHNAGIDFNESYINTNIDNSYNHYYIDENNLLKEKVLNLEYSVSELENTISGLNKLLEDKDSEADQMISELMNSNEKEKEILRKEIELKISESSNSNNNDFEIKFNLFKAETVARISEEITKNAELNELLKKKEEEISLLSNHSTNLKSLHEKTIQDYDAKFDLLKSSENELKAERDAIFEELTVLKDLHASSENSLLILQREFDLSKVTISQLEINLESENQFSKSLRESSSEQNMLIDEKEMKLNEELNSLNQLREQLALEKVELNFKISEYQAKLQDIDLKTSNYDHDLILYSENLISFDAKVSLFEESCNLREQSIVKLESDFEKRRNNIELDLSLREKNLFEREEKLQIDISQYSQKLSDFENDVRNLELERNDLNEKIRSYENSLINFENSVQQHELNVFTHIQSVRDYQVSVSESELNSQEDLKNRIAAFEIQLSNFEEDKRIYIQNLAELQKKEFDLSQNNSLLNYRVPLLEEEIAQLKLSLLESNPSLDNSEWIVKEKGYIEKIVDLEEKLKLNESKDPDDATNKLKKYVVAYRTIKQEADNYKVQISSLQSTVDELRANNIITSENVKPENDIIFSSQIQSLTSDYESKIENLNFTLNSLKDDFAGERDHLILQISNFESEIAKLNEKIVILTSAAVVEKSRPAKIVTEKVKNAPAKHQERRKSSIKNESFGGFGEDDDFFNSFAGDNSQASVEKDEFANNTDANPSELDEILALRDQVNKFQVQEQRVHSKLANLEEQYTDKSSKIMIEMQRKLVHAELQEKMLHDKISSLEAKLSSVGSENNREYRVFELENMVSQLRSSLDSVKLDLRQSEHDREDDGDMYQSSMKQLVEENDIKSKEYEMNVSNLQQQLNNFQVEHDRILDRVKELEFENNENSLNLKQQIDANNRLEGQIENYNKTQNDLNTTIQNISFDKSTLEGEISVLSSRIVDLNAQKLFFEGENSSLNSQIIVLTATNAEMEVEVQNLKSEKAVLSSERYELEKNIISLKGLLSAAESSIQKKSEMVEVTPVKPKAPVDEGSVSKIGQLIEKYKKLSEAYKLLQGSVELKDNDFNLKFATFNEERSLEKSKLESSISLLADEKQHLELKLVEVQNELLRIKENTYNTASAMFDEKSFVEFLEPVLSLFPKEGEKSKTASESGWEDDFDFIGSSDIKGETFSEMINRLKFHVESLKFENNASSEKVSSFDKEITDFKVKNDKLMAFNKSLSENESNLKNELNLLKIEFKALDSKNDHLKKSLEKSHFELTLCKDSYSKEINLLNDRILELNNSISYDKNNNPGDSNIATLESEIAKLREELNTSQLNYSGLFSAQEAIIADSEEMESELRSLRLKLANYVSDSSGGNDVLVFDLQEQLRVANNNLSSFEFNCNELDAKLKESNNLLSQSENRYRKLFGEFEEIEVKLDNSHRHAATLSELEDKFKLLQHENFQLHNQLKSHASLASIPVDTNKDQSLNEQILELENTNSVLSEDLSEMKRKCQQLISELAVLKQKELTHEKQKFEYVETKIPHSDAEAERKYAELEAKFKTYKAHHRNLHNVHCSMRDSLEKHERKLIDLIHTLEYADTNYRKQAQLKQDELTRKIDLLEGKVKEFDSANKPSLVGRLFGSSEKSTATLIWNPVLKKWGGEGEAEEDEEITEELPPTRPAAALVGGLVSLFEKNRETWSVINLPEDGTENISSSSELKNINPSPVPSSSPISSPLMPRRSPTMPSHQKAPVASRYATAVGLEVVPSSSPTQPIPALPTFVAPITAKKPNIFMPKMTMTSTPIYPIESSPPVVDKSTEAPTPFTNGNPDHVVLSSQVPTTPLQPIKKPAVLENKSLPPNPLSSLRKPVGLKNLPQQPGSRTPSIATETTPTMPQQMTLHSRPMGSDGSVSSLPNHPNNLPSRPISSDAASYFNGLPPKPITTDLPPQIIHSPPKPIKFDLPPFPNQFPLQPIVAENSSINFTPEVSEPPRTFENFNNVNLNLNNPHQSDASNHDMSSFSLAPKKINKHVPPLIAITEDNGFKVEQQNSFPGNSVASNLQFRASLPQVYTPNSMPGDKKLFSPTRKFSTEVGVVTPNGGGRTPLASKFLKGRSTSPSLLSPSARSSLLSPSARSLSTQGCSLIPFLDNSISQAKSLLESVQLIVAFLYWHNGLPLPSSNYNFDPSIDFTVELKLKWKNDANFLFEIIGNALENKDDIMDLLIGNVPVSDKPRVNRVEKLEMERDSLLKEIQSLKLQISLGPISRLPDATSMMMPQLSNSNEVNEKLSLILTRMNKVEETLSNQTEQLTLNSSLLNNNTTKNDTDSTSSVLSSGKECFILNTCYRCLSALNVSTIDN